VNASMLQYRILHPNCSRQQYMQVEVLLYFPGPQLSAISAISELQLLMPGTQYKIITLESLHQAKFQGASCGCASVPRGIWSRNA
jgi:hypothetical protein